MVTSARIQPASNSDFLSSHPGVLPFLPQTPLFGTDGIRGKAGELLNAPFAQAVGFWAGRVLRTAAGTSGPVLIGQDSRNSSDMLAMSLASGLTAAGLEVWHLGLCPTPCVAYACAKTEAIAGIMVSASHNPPEDNGIKFFDWRGWKLSASIADRIEACLRGTVVDELEMTRWGKYYPRPLLVNGYLEALRLGLPSGLNLAGMRVVLDLAWGAATGVAPQLFRTLGAEVIELHPRPDGDRINVNCGSTHLNSLQTAVQAHEADLGLAFDGDADRVLAVDGRGRVVDGDAILYFWGRSLQAAGRLPDNLLVATVMANLGFERAWLALGGQLIRTKVGDKYVQQSMWETGAMLGGEQSGHIICHHYSCSGDGLQTAVHLAALTQQAGVSLAELMDESFPTYPQLLRNVRVEDCSRRRNWQSCEPLQGEIVRAETAMGDEGRVLVRASGTEPVIRVMVEAADGALADYWCEHLVATVERYLA